MSVLVAPTPMSQKKNLPKQDSENLSNERMEKIILGLSRCTRKIKNNRQLLNPTSQLRGTSNGKIPTFCWPRKATMVWKPVSQRLPGHAWRRRIRWRATTSLLWCWIRRPCKLGGRRCHNWLSGHWHAMPSSWIWRMRRVNKRRHLMLWMVPKDILPILHLGLQSSLSNKTMSEKC